MKLDGWRICKAKYSTSVGEMLSGEGSRRFGGRWNSKGIPIVYLGSSIAQAALEMLVHLKTEDILKHYCKLRVSFMESLVEHLDVADFPKNWAEPRMASAAQNTGDKWFQARSSLILQVPSAVVNGETNYLLNPGHPDFKKLEIGEISSFIYDERLKIKNRLSTRV